MTTDTGERPLPLTARARARAEVTREIKAVARRHLAEVGAAALSLRAVAREVGMVSSAVYRYFPSRDDLLTALIIDAYDAVGAAAEDADSDRASPAMRWARITRAVRAWALANPHEYALVYGSPVPGYAAPADTIGPATRVSAVLVRLLCEGVASGQVAVARRVPLPAAVRADLRGVCEALGVALAPEVLAAGMAAWSQMFGVISLELFGHLHNVVHDFDAWFDHQMRLAFAPLTPG